MSRLDSSADSVLNGGVTTGDDETVKRVFVGIPEAEYTPQVARHHALNLVVSSAFSALWPNGEDRGYERCIEIAADFADFILNGVSE